MQLKFNTGLVNQDNKITPHCNFQIVSQTQTLFQMISFSPINYDIFSAYFQILNASVQKCTKKIRNVQGFLASSRANPKNLWHTIF